MCNLHWCYTFYTGVTLFAVVLHLNCTALSQLKSSSFFVCIIRLVKGLTRRKPRLFHAFIHLQFRIWIFHFQIDLYLQLVLALTPVFADKAA